ncbi:MAG: hypothetical protein K0R93_2189 [Anaerosolibacter sp.]|uniref:selenium cofactor biosynthesis protein YqeC n=1 Tax=Anaerosolibacter sp. TaxID=1872527 RepID=UPI002610D71F|nr:selenium cofactor biosynthesis protein YqeC [Anaerosolibacter sp.]MDF2547291.1 hypothetical protein [Anaerosolibacter sp.]
MKFTDVVAIVPGRALSFVGCGGKTSVIESVIKELSSSNMPVIHTTTTKIWVPEAADRLILISDNIELLKEKIMKSQKIMITIGKGITEEGKLLGIPQQWIEPLEQAFPNHCLLVEADGCKGRSIKFYGDNEPCVPKGSQTRVILLGLDAFEDRDMYEVAHRPQGFLKNFHGERPTMKERIESLFWPRGLISGAGIHGDTYVFLNKVTDSNLTLAREIAKTILTIGGNQIAGVMIGNTRTAEICREVME